MSAILRVRRAPVAILCILLALCLLPSCGRSDPTTSGTSGTAASGTAAPGTTADTGPYTETERGERNMDMIMWYDIDHGRTANTRPDRGWYYLYEGHPGASTQHDIRRATTPLLGLYDQGLPGTANQHLYWIAALGCNAIVCDWTNYFKYTTDTADSAATRYFTGIHHSTQVLLEQAIADRERFDTPSVYVAVRLFGENFEALRKVLDEVYELYASYREKWYVLDDGTDRAEKPMILIFADHTYLRKWAAQGYADFDDARFNIRWTNGSVLWDTDADGNHCSPMPGFWSFWDCIRREDDSYETCYAGGENGSVEQMSAWASVHLGGLNWDAMLQEENGMTTFARTMAPVRRMMPKALLVCRFNYPIVWLDEPQEGVSLLESTHIEPNVDLGFAVFDDVRQNLYDVLHWKKHAPQVVVESSTADTVCVSVADFPQEYRIAGTEDFAGAAWTMFHIDNQIQIPAALAGQTVYVALRNAFGESEAVRLTWDGARGAYTAA